MACRVFLAPYLYSALLILIAASVVAGAQAKVHDECRPGGDGCLRDRPFGTSCCRSVGRLMVFDNGIRQTDCAVFSRRPVYRWRSLYWSIAVGACTAACWIRRLPRQLHSSTSFPTTPSSK